MRHFIACGVAVLSCSGRDQRAHETETGAADASTGALDGATTGDRAAAPDAKSVDTKSPDSRAGDGGGGPDAAGPVDAVPVDPSGPKTFSVCTGLPELIRPGVTDDWDSYWWDGTTLKVMVFQTLSQASSFEQMHNKPPLGSLVLTRDYQGQGDKYTLGVGQGTFDTRASIPVSWWGTSVSKDPDNSNAYMLYHIEYTTACNGISSFTSGTGLAVSTDGGFNWSDRGIVVGEVAPIDCADRGPSYIVRGGISTPHVAKEGDYYYVSMDNISGGTPTDSANQGIIWARISLLDIRRGDAAKRFRFYNGSGTGGRWNVSTQTGQICPSSDPATCAGENVFATNVHPIALPGGQASWRKTGPITESFPAGSQRVTWNGNTGTFIMLLKDFTLDYPWSGRPSLMYHAGESLSSDPLNWRAFETCAGADGKKVTTGAGQRSYLVFPGAEADVYYNTLVSPFDGTEKEVSAGHDMRFFSVRVGPSVGQPVSTIGVKFTAGSTPPSCSLGIR